MFQAMLDSSAHELDSLEAHVQSRLGGRVRHLQLLLRGQGIILKGEAQSYYVKQLAQHAVMQTSDYLILANEIEVSRVFGEDFDARKPFSVVDTGTVETVADMTLLPL